MALVGTDTNAEDADRQHAIVGQLKKSQFSGTYEPVTPSVLFCSDVLVESVSDVKAAAMSYGVLLILVIVRLSLPVLEI